MNWNSPKGISLRIALILAAIVAAIFLVVGCYYLNEWCFGTALLIFLVVGLAGYFITSGLLERFVHRKIKLIYRTIHNLKTGKDLKNEMDAGMDVMGEANEAVKEWAKNQKDQIDELKEKENYRREFIGNVSHELKTPIFNIQGYILTLLEGGMEDPAINKKYLERAGKGVDRLITIVEDLDTISRFEANRLELELKKTDMVVMVKEAFESLEMNAQTANIDLKFKKPQEKPVWVMADGKRIRQVVGNLLLNSINYGKEGGTTEVRFYDMDENMLIEIADDGIGIDEEHLPRLFERFYRVDQSRSREKGGSGLGLAIVKHIIEAHKQTINVRSKVGEGSRFSFTLKKA